MMTNPVVDHTKPNALALIQTSQKRESEELNLNNSQAFFAEDNLFKDTTNSRKRDEKAEQKAMFDS